MLTKHIDANDAQTQLHEMLSQLASGVEWVLTDKMIPVARIVPVTGRKSGLHAGTIWTSPDFYESAPVMFEG